MVLELRAPDQPAFSALWPLWPTATSYAVSYLFIAIIRINHYYLMRFVGPPTLRLIWINFVHLFMVSLLPFATAWIARTRLASSLVAFYAGLFVCIDIAYNVFEREVLAPADATQVSEDTRRMARRRSLGVLASFTTAMLVLQQPLARPCVPPAPSLYKHSMPPRIAQESYRPQVSDRTMVGNSATVTLARFANRRTPSRP
jgi:uncharacterized membrane protein